MKSCNKEFSTILRKQIKYFANVTYSLSDCRVHDSDFRSEYCCNIESLINAGNGGGRIMCHSGAKRVNNRTYCLWRHRSSAREAKNTNDDNRYRDDDNPEREARQASACLPTEQNAFVKEFHSSARQSSLARTRVPSRPAL